MVTPSANESSPIAKSGVIVSGASSGLGRESAILAAKAGRSVAVWGRDPKRTEAVAEICRAEGVEVIGLAFDITDQQAVIDAVSQSEQAIGTIGALSINHGIHPFDTFGALNFKDFDACLKVNLTSLAYIIEAALPALRKAGKGTAIVAALSTNALRASPFGAAYTASKHGALGLIRAAARRLGPEGIRVNAVCPGAMATPMMEKSMRDLGADRDQVIGAMEAAIALGYVADPIEVAYVMHFLISPESCYINGADIPVDGGMIV